MRSARRSRRCARGRGGNPSGAAGRRTDFLSVLRPNGSGFFGGPGVGCSGSHDAGRRDAALPATPVGSGLRPAPGTAARVVLPAAGLFGPRCRPGADGRHPRRAAVSLLLSPRLAARTAVRPRPLALSALSAPHLLRRGPGRGEAAGPNGRRRPPRRTAGRCPRPSRGADSPGNGRQPFSPFHTPPRPPLHLALLGTLRACPNHRRARTARVGRRATFPWLRFSSLEGSMLVKLFGNVGLALVLIVAGTNATASRPTPAGGCCGCSCCEVGCPGCDLGCCPCCPACCPATPAKADCCAAGADCCDPPQACCAGAKAEADCCAAGADCCSPPQPCCAAARK
jgi:hypothetical protein